MNKQKIIDYIEELERKAQDGERYFKLWHEEYHKNKQAIEYIEEHNIIETNKEYLPGGIAKCCSLELMEILKGVDKE